MCNFRAADIKFTRFLSSFCFQCFESGEKGEHLPQCFQRAGADFFIFLFLSKNMSEGREKMFRTPLLNVSNNSAAAEKGMT